MNLNDDLMTNGQLAFIIDVIFYLPNIQGDQNQKYIHSKMRFPLSSTLYILQYQFFILVSLYLHYVKNYYHCRE